MVVLTCSNIAGQTGQDLSMGKGRNRPRPTVHPIVFPLFMNRVKN
jgi:hypothetical protein